MELVDSYLKPSNTEKKKFGEVMTPLELVKEMMVTLPEEVWSNPDLKWLDPANGIGNFPVVIVKNLMDGLKEWQPDSELRLKHILENQIYVCELQSKNMFIYLQLFDSENQYKLNFHRGSFLDENFSEVMKEWGVDKMDIVIGNPPYNNEVSVSGTSSDIYDEFIFKSDEISDRIIMITPSKWFDKPDKEKLRNLLIKEGRLEKIVTDNKSFDELNIRGGVSYFLTTKENKDLVNFNGEDKNLKEQFNLFGFIFKDQKESDLIKSILDKTSKFTKLSTIFNGKSYFGLKTNHKDIATNGTKCYFSGRQKKELNLSVSDSGRHYSFVKNFKDTKSKKDKWKLITPAAYGFKTKSENTYNEIGGKFISPPGEVCTETFVFFDLNSEIECKILKIYLETKFVKFLISLKKYKQHVTSKIFDIIPMVPFDREWTDEKLFEYFGLTEEEKNIILNYDKK